MAVFTFRPQTRPIIPQSTEASASTKTKNCKEDRLRMSGCGQNMDRKHHKMALTGPHLNHAWAFSASSAISENFTDLLFLAKICGSLFLSKTNCFAKMTFTEE